MRKNRSFAKRAMIICLMGTSFFLLSSFVSSSEDGGGGVFWSRILHPNYPCPATTVTWITYLHGTAVVSINYSNGAVAAGAAFGQSVTSQTTGGPAVYPGFNVTWIECSPETGSGCTSCPPPTACILGCPQS